jgi:hypothetical protein
MQRFLTGLVALVLGLALAGFAEAKPPGGNGHSNNGNGYSNGMQKGSGNSQMMGNNHSSGFDSKSSSFLNSHGTKFSGGYCYMGKDHSHWTYSCYSTGYGCNFYWCPYACCYYYWCEPAGCYYPYSYIKVCPPTVTTVTTQTAVQVTSPTVIQGQSGPAPGPIPQP